MSHRELIKALPKAELHLHIEGSLEPELMFKLARRNGIELKFKDIAEIQKAYNFHNLQSFLDIYYEGAGVLIKEEDFYDLCWEYLERAHADNVIHTEIFFDPQTHTERGVDFETVISGLNRALTDAEEKWGMTSHLIMCFLRHLSEEEAFKTLEMAKPFITNIRGVGLDSSEVGNPPSKFERVFAACRELGLDVVAHAGEEGPPEYIWEALDILKARRIDHGVRCLEDEKLIERLREGRVPLTVCPLSNIKLCVFKDMKDHNLKELLDRGLCAMINSDDPAYFGGYLNQNFFEVDEALHLTEDHIRQLVKNSFEASMMPEPRRQEIYHWIDSL